MQSLNIGIISDNLAFNNHINKLLSSYNYCFKEKPDESCNLFIINKKEIDEDTFLELHNHKSIIIADDSKYSSISLKTIDSGTLVLKKPAKVGHFNQALLICKKYLEKLEKLDSSKLNEINHIDVAKILLIINENINEDMAHKYIEKLAMNSRITKLKASEIIINKYLNIDR